MKFDFQIKGMCILYTPLICHKSMIQHLHPKRNNESHLDTYNFVLKLNKWGIISGGIPELRDNSLNQHCISK